MPPDPPQQLLDVAGITAGYRRLQVLWGVDFAVHEHESVVLLGANGAGKTTLLKAIMSLVDVWAGHINFAGKNIGRLRTDQRVQRGIVFMSEASGFPGLTVEENVLIGAQFLPAKRTRQRIDELYAIFPALAERRRLAACPAASARCSVSPRRWSAIRGSWSWTSRRPAYRRSMSRK